MITCVAVSEKPWEHSRLSRKLRYLNLVRPVGTCEELHTARLEAIDKVKSDVFFFQDTTDSMPSHMVDSIGTVGFVRGPIKTIEFFDDGREFVRVFTPEQHHVCRAFVDTEKAQKVGQYLPKGNFDTYVLLFHFLEKAYGSTVDPKLEMAYRKVPLGLHMQAQPAIENSLKWIALHESRILSYL